MYSQGKILINLQKSTILLFSLLVIGTSVSCRMHFSQIYSNRPKSLIDHPTTKTKIEFVRIPESHSNESLGMFNNEKFKSDFIKSPYFFLDEKSDLKIKYQTKSKSLEESGASAFVFTITLGAIPLREDSQSEVEFNIIQKRTNKQIASYKYTIRQSSWFGWLSIPMSLFVLPFADKVKELTTDEGLDLHERITSRFSKNFALDLKNGKYSGYLVAKAKMPRSAYLVIEGNETEKKYHEQSKMLANLLEVSLVNGRYKVTDRKNISQILKEQKISQSGLTKKDTARIGQLSGAKKIVTGNVIYYNESNDIYKTTYIIHITDIQTGEVEWKNLYTLTGKNIDEMFAEGSKKLIRDLSFAGYR